MSAAKSKVAPTNGASSKGKASSTNGTTTPVSTVDKKDTSDALAALAGGKPDKKAYDAEQDKVKKEIDALQVKLSAVRDKISLATKSGSGNDRRTVLRAELDEIRGQQSNTKLSRGKIIDQVKAIQDGIQKKIKDIQAAKGKVTFKTVAEVDAHINNLEKQVESGSMKLVEEKRALQDISTSKRNRRLVESFQADQESIEADRAKVDELRKQLDDPEFKAIHDRYDAIKAELDELKKEGDEAYAGRSKLFEERDNIQSELNTLYNQKRESANQYREANDRYWNKVNEDRARRAERARAQRAEEEAQKKHDIAERLREEAEAPAFQAQIEDCQTLIDSLSGKSTGNVTYKSAPLTVKAELTSVPKLEIRQVEAAPEGSIVRKKKDEDQESYFVGGKGKAKGKKGGAKAVNGNGAAPTSPSTGSSNLNLPLPTLSALLSLSIPPPVSADDVPRVVEDLKTKKAWFEANQKRVTAENVAKAESDIQRLTNSVKDAAKTASTSPPVGDEKPAESNSTPQAGEAAASEPPPSDQVDEVLEQEKVAGKEES